MGSRSSTTRIDSGTPTTSSRCGPRTIDRLPLLVAHGRSRSVRNGRGWTDGRARDFALDRGTLSDVVPGRAPPRLRVHGRWPSREPLRHDANGTWPMVDAGPIDRVRRRVSAMVAGWSVDRGDLPGRPDSRPRRLGRTAGDTRPG